MAAISLDLRKRILEALDEESSSNEVGKRFKVSGSFVRKLRVQVQRTKDPAPRQAPGKERLVQGLDEECLKRLVRKHSDATLLDLAALLKKERRIEVSETTMWRSLRRLGITLKKRPSTPRKETGRM